MTEALESLLMQAELKKLQLQVSHQFAKNMALFEQRFPAIHDKFKSFLPEKIELKLDGQQQLNLLNRASNTFLYSDPAHIYCEKQVELFKQSSYINRLRIGESKSYNDRHLHIRYLNELVKEYDTDKATCSLSSNGIITNLVMTSIGIGYHLPILIKELDIYNLFLYERSLDIFYACLHVIDWQPILDHFKENNRSITFCLGFEPDRALIEIEQSISRIGLHNHVFTFLYKHTKRQDEQDFFKHYIKEINNASSGLGYYDDEQIGFAHTIHNLAFQHPIFTRPKRRNAQLPPAFIIGNGPSLDMHEDFLKERCDNAIIFSCGTSFGSLSKIKVKPDFHVEMERTISMKDLLDFGTTEEDRENVTLLCLNPVSPKLISSFDDVCLALKPNDIGEVIIQKHYDQKKIIKLPFSNPTVSNSALSFAISMGFKEIYLIGVDLGLADKGQHHSKNSPHYKLNKHIKDIKEVIYTYNDRNFKTKGNLGGKVTTHATLDRARISIERLLHYTKIAIPDFCCFNSNNGAYIQGTTPISIDQIKNFNDIDKRHVIEQIKDNTFFYQDKKSTVNLKDTGYLDYFFSIEKQVQLKTSISNAQEFHQEAERIYKLINKKNDAITHMLLSGSINLFLGLIMENSAYCLDKEKYKSQVKKGIKKFNIFMEKVYINMKNEPLRIDDTHNDTIHRLNRESQDIQQAE